MFCHAGPSSLIFSDSDLQIQISQNGLHLKLKLHPLWRTTLWLKIQIKNYLGFTHPSAKFHFRSTENKLFIGQLWQLMTASNAGVRTQAWQAKWVVFKIPGFVCKRFLAFFPTPSTLFYLRHLSRGQIDSRSSFFAPKLHRNACYAGYYPSKGEGTSATAQSKERVKGPPQPRPTQDDHQRKLLVPSN